MRWESFCTGLGTSAFAEEWKSPAQRRKNRIRRFVTAVVRAVKHDEYKGMIMYMDESRVHQLRGSAHSYFFTDKDAAV